MNDLAQKLIEELQCETVFTIPVLGGIPVSEAVVVTWIIMAVLVIVFNIFIITVRAYEHNKQILEKLPYAAVRIMVDNVVFIDNLIEQ